jgi:hypothetical protein
LTKNLADKSEEPVPHIEEESKVEVTTPKKKGKLAKIVGFLQKKKPVEESK